ncbi:hypothetical protein GCM10010919_32260 [Alishewanella longhuensis]|uniref:Uncharacterized protein n=1 Tax=Alishewanella longhuensis TaxID=1091037 RepID=A0ABQ3L688_9ALTE|nr:hypothetical protein GCM10010919_32260 [Alishewanella longhuensis]
MLLVLNSWFFIPQSLLISNVKKYPLECLACQNVLKDGPQYAEVKKVAYFISAVANKLCCAG